MVCLRIESLRIDAANNHMGLSENLKLAMPLPDNKRMLVIAQELRVVRF